MPSVIWQWWLDERKDILQRDWMWWFVGCDFTEALYILEFCCQYCHLHHLLLQQNPGWPDILQLAYPRCLGNWLLRAGSGVVRIDLLHFLAGCPKRRLNQALSVFVLVYILLLIRANFYVLLVYVSVCSVFWLFWLSCQYLPSDWLERILWGSLTMARGMSPESPG